MYPLASLAFCRVRAAAPLGKPHDAIEEREVGEVAVRAMHIAQTPHERKHVLNRLRVAHGVDVRMVAPQRVLYELLVNTDVAGRNLCRLRDGLPSVVGASGKCPDDGLDQAWIRVSKSFGRGQGTARSAGPDVTGAADDAANAEILHHRGIGLHHRRRITALSEQRDDRAVARGLALDLSVL